MRNPASASVAGDLSFVTVSVVLCGLLLSPRITALLAALHLTGILLTAILFPALIPFSQLAGLLLLVGSLSALAVAAASIHRRDRRKIDRQGLSLREAGERFYLVSYATSDVVWDWDLSTGQVWRNQGIQRLFGYQADQIGLEMDWWEARIHPADREKVTEGLRAAIAGVEKFWSKEYRFQRVDGTYADVFDRAYILRDDAGRPTRVLGAVMDISARNQAEEVLRQEAVHDPLTGLFNRRYMEEMLEGEMRRAQRNRQPISIIMLDIDHFKPVNDTFGHAAGDAMLHKLGGFLLEHVRGTDIACRYGGDEFVLILPNTSLDVAQQRAETLCVAARNLSVDLYGQALGPLSLSLGVAMFPRQGSTRETIMQAADAALYSAKQAGRNQVFVAP